MYNLAILTRRHSHDAFEAPGEMALICKTYFTRDLGDGPSLAEQRSSLLHAHLCEVCVRWETYLISKHVGEVEGAQVGDASQPGKGYVFGVMRF